MENKNQEMGNKNQGLGNRSQRMGNGNYGVGNKLWSGKQIVEWEIEIKFGKQKSWSGKQKSIMHMHVLLTFALYIYISCD